MTTQEFIDAIKAMSVMELNDLVKACEEEFGVSAAAGVVVAAAGADGAARGGAGQGRAGQDRTGQEAPSGTAAPPPPEAGWASRIKYAAGRTPGGFFTHCIKSGKTAHIPGKPWIFMQRYNKYRKTTV